VPEDDVERVSTEYWFGRTHQERGGSFLDLRWNMFCRCRFGYLAGGDIDIGVLRCYRRLDYLE
jgi:hypothetical protein